MWPGASGSPGVNHSRRRDVTTLTFVVKTLISILPGWCIADGGYPLSPCAAVHAAGSLPPLPESRPPPPPGIPLPSTETDGRLDTQTPELPDRMALPECHPVPLFPPLPYPFATPNHPQPYCSAGNRRTKVLGQRGEVTSPLRPSGCKPFPSALELSYPHRSMAKTGPPRGVVPYPGGEFSCGRTCQAFRTPFCPIRCSFRPVGTQHTCVGQVST